MNNIFKKYLWSDVLFKVKDYYYLLKFGYKLSDTWNINTSLSRWILPRLKHFKDNLNGHPMGLTEEEWKIVLDKIIFSFEFILKEDDYLIECYPADFDWGFKVNENNILEFNDKRKPDYSSLELKEKQYEEGIRLFSQYYRHLWS